VLYVQSIKKLCINTDYGILIVAFNPNVLTGFAVAHDVGNL
jgi:hypothetical protein